MIRVTTSNTAPLSFGALAFLTLGLALASGCGEAEVAPPRGDGGTAGSGGTAGTGGTAGSAGGCGFFACGGAGGASGAGGMGGIAGSGGGAAGSGGTAGMAGAGGSGGVAGGGGACVTNALCHTCPDRFICNTDANCFGGYVCTPSGCETQAGAAIKHCQPSKAPSCVDVGDCPNSVDYSCGSVAGGPTRCLRGTAGCNPSTESYDCQPGFSCENGVCVDRRVPCNDYRDCPKSHVCRVEPTASYCVRVYRTCHQDSDCAGFGAFCDDIDGDGSMECAGELGSSGEACVNTDCSSPSAPVCDAAGTGTTAACGNYGLCRNHMDCGPGFECLDLWQDGRSECVPTDGLCDQVTQCPLNQVCAAPRNGDSPSCQTGSAP